MGAEEAAWGLAEVVDENMTNAARVHAVENGEDLGRYTMIAFGGAAPLHAARLCEKLGIARCLVPEGAGVGSAIGFLRAPFSFEANRSVFMRMSGFDVAIARRLFVEMEEEATRFVRSCDATSPIAADHRVYMRYAGQGWEIPVPLTPEEARAADPAVILARFEADYATLFGRTVEGMEAEITVWSVNARTPTAPVIPVADPAAAAAPEPIAERRLFDAGAGRAASAAVYSRDTFFPGAEVAGPALITEDETTIVLPASRSARRLADGCIDITVKGA
jgi:N-methylhydantoinase A